MSDIYVTEHNNHISVNKTTNEVSILSPGTVGPAGGAGEISSATATATEVAVDGSGDSQDPTVSITLGGTSTIRTMAFAFGVPTGASGAGVVYKEAWATSTSYVHRDLVRYSDNNLYFCKVAHTSSSGNNPTADSAKWALFINANDAYQWATKAKHSQITDSLSQTGYSALHQAGKAQDWASLTTDAVTNDANGSDVDYSAKAWAVGGTEVTSTASRGAAKEWATTTGAKVDGGSGDYSAKEYATGTTATSAKTYATKVDGAVTGTDFSSKAWAVGGTNVTTTSSRGASKEWATTLGGKVDTSEYSAKEFAIGVTATLGSAKSWASKIEDSPVAGGLYSALHYSAKAEDFKTAAETAKTSAESALATFQSLFHGASTSTPSSNVSDGDLWFDTTTGVNAMKVYNADDTVWQQLGPSASSQTNIDILTTKYDGSTSASSGTNLNIAQVDTVADNIANVNKVGVIDANVTKVANIDSNVTTVAGIGTDGADVTTVAGKATEIGRLGTSAMATASTGHLALLGTSAMAHASTGHIKKVADIDSNVTTVAGISANVTTVAGVSANVTTVATNIADVNNFADLYQIDDFSPSAPTTDGGGNSVAEGDLAYDSTANKLKFYDGSAWVDSTGISLSQVQAEANAAAISMSIALG